MHTDELPFNNPLTEAQIRAALRVLDLKPESRLLDVGCGRGALLAFAAETYGCQVVGVDPNARDIDRARLRLSDARATLHSFGIEDFPAQEQGFDAAACIGASHAFGQDKDALPNTLRQLPRFLRPAGRLIIGEGFWMQTPPQAYLRATGFQSDSLGSHEDNIALAESLGLTLLHCAISPRDEWDVFERCFWESAEQNLAREPDNLDFRTQAKHWRNWKQAYLQWGRETLGFAVYVFAS